MVCVLVFGALCLSPTRSQSPDSLIQMSIAGDEPITPIPEPSAKEQDGADEMDLRKVALGEHLFGDSRLSGDNSHSCSSCHDLRSNGAGGSSATDPDTADLALNTLTVFNAALNFRLGWEGKFRSLESQALASMESPRNLGSNISEVVKKLDADPLIRGDFIAAYGGPPDEWNVVDAIASFERSLVTPGSRFDRWLAGDGNALSEVEQEGYRQFKSLGCSSCHQGVNIGGNLLERHGIFHPLASPRPEILRVPSLRNVAATAPYFHDGSAPTLEDAVRKMGYAQLDTRLSGEQVDAIVAYLKTLTGTYRGKAVGAAP
jgi:cytochrome c peroxidase